jgi:hypothetical protein
VAAGRDDDFEVEVRVPPQVRGYTAIGSIISRTYHLFLEAEVNCCLSNPELEIHAILYSDLDPELDPAEERHEPADWNPTVAKQAIFANLPPYIYNPSKRIVIRNQSGDASMLEDMGTEIMEKH